MNYNTRKEVATGIIESVFEKGIRPSVLYKSCSTNYLAFENIPRNINSVKKYRD